MFRLALVSLKFRKGRFFASFVALFFGALILMACGSLMETGIRSNVPPERLAAAPVVVTGNQSFDHDVLPERVRLDVADVERVRAVEGVERAVPDVTFPVTAVRDGQPASGGEDLQGHGWSSATLAAAKPAEGRAPSGAGQVALDERLARSLDAKPGDKLRLAVAGGTENVTVTGIARPVEGASAAVYFADDEARRLLGRPGQVDSIAVVAASGTGANQPKLLAGRIDEVLKDAPAVTLTGDERGEAEFPEALAASTRLISLSAVFGGIAVMVAVFVVGSTLALLVQQRLREMALLRAVGTLPHQLRRMIVGETLVIAVVAVALALVPGRWAGEWMLQRLAGGGVVAPEIVFRAGWLPMMIAAITALASAVAAAFIASRRAARARPADALAESALQQRWLSRSRLVFALLCFAGGTALALVTALVMEGTVAASTAAPAAMLWAGGFALLSPAFTRLLTALLRRPVQAMTGFAGSLALNNAKVRRIRMAGAVTPVMLATGLATALIYLQTSQAEATEDAARELVAADTVVSSGTGGFSPGLVDTLSRQPGVAGASAYVPSTAYIIKPQSEEDKAEGDDPDNTELSVQGISPQGADRTLAAPPVEGSYKNLKGNTIALPTSLTGESGQAVGDTVTLLLGDGTQIKAKVVASYEARKGFGTAFLPADLMLEHSTTGLVPQILVTADQGTSTAQLAERIGAVTDDLAGVRIVDRASTDSADDSATSAWINYLLAGTIVGYAVISLVNTMIIAASERRREFALQRLVGATPEQILRMMTVESALVALVGMVLGTAVAAATLIPFGIALGGSGLPQGPVWIYFAVMGLAALLTLGASLLPTKVMLRGRPADAVAVA
ncbi:FtsX-like permease family protein [Streptomyces sp. NPDC059002]|uniref:FtsX-like permease family protein n=1 Tax=Streptomyces sp. NPDC059002 TaxID=3346690 RepID=UPI0036A7417A